MAPLELNPYERLPREQQQSGGLPWHLFSFSILLLIIACGAYLGLKFGYAPILSSRIETLDADLVTLAEQIPEAQRAGFIQLYSQITNLQSVLQKHVMTSVVLPLVERNTHTDIYYSNFDLSVSENRLTLEGVARSYEVLAQQLGAWANVKEVEKSYVAESQFSEGRVRFRMVLQLSPSLLAPRAAGNVAGAFLEVGESGSNPVTPRVGTKAQPQIVPLTNTNPNRVGSIAIPIR